MSPSASAADHRIQRARALIAEYDVPSARAILEAVAAGPPGAAWAAARVELVALGYGGAAGPGRPSPQEPPGRWR